MLDQHCQVPIRRTCSLNLTEKLAAYQAPQSKRRQQAEIFPIDHAWNGQPFGVCYGSASTISEMWLRSASSRWSRNGIVAGTSNPVVSARPNTRDGTACETAQAVSLKPLGFVRKKTNGHFGSSLRYRIQDKASSHRRRKGLPRERNPSHHWLAKQRLGQFPEPHQFAYTGSV
jgi:hypothetical protein